MRHITFELSEDELTDGDTCWLVTCPQIAGFKTHAPTIDEALEMAVSLLQDLQCLRDEASDWLGEYADAVTTGTRVKAWLNGVEMEVEAK